MRIPENLVAPKKFFIDERDRAYNNWPESFWRELFQNSIDAGASEIRIDLKEVPGKGSFGRPPLVDRVTRVIFDDNGCGMDEHTLRDVYFRPGETTKNDGTTTGGYGRARLMTCFSQVRYAIRTRDMIVEGDGPEFYCAPIKEAVEDAREELLRLREEMEDDGQGLEAERRYARLYAYLEELQEMAPHHDGCRLEIDINPDEYPDRPWRNVTISDLEGSLRTYLSQAQLYVSGTNRPCKVFVNGEEWTRRLRKGKAVKVIDVELEDGRIVPMATIHLNKSADPDFQGKVIFRIEGAPMLTKSVSTSAQVIVELNKQHSREFLTSNRDAFRGHFANVIDEFIQEIAIDNRSALEDVDDIRHDVVHGGQGTLEVVSEVDLSHSFTDAEVADYLPPEVQETVEQSEAGERRLTLSDLYRFVGEEVVSDFLKELGSQETFLTHYGDNYAQNLFVEAVQNGAPERAFEEASAPFQEFIFKQLAAHAARRKQSLRSELHNIHVRSENPTPEIKRAMARYNPERWGKVTKSYGSDAMALQAAWQVCCKHAVQTLMRVAPDAPGVKDGKIKIETGWLFKPSTEAWMGDNYGKRRTGAQHMKRGDTHVLLLNPVDDKGNKAYKLTDPADIQKLMTLAVHEATHIVSRRHDEYWAEIMTGITSAFDFQKSGKVASEIKTAVAKAREMFKNGTATVEHVDPTPAGSVRPAEKLAALSAPMASMLSGMAASPENENKSQAKLLADAYQLCFSHQEDHDNRSTTVVDATNLQALEEGVCAVLNTRLEAAGKPKGVDDGPEQENIYSPFV